MLTRRVTLRSIGVMFSNAYKEYSTSLDTLTCRNWLKNAAKKTKHAFMSGIAAHVPVRHTALLADLFWPV